MVNLILDYVFNSFIKLNLIVVKRIFKKTKFLDQEVEKQYLRETKTNSLKNKIIIDAFMIFSYLATLAYIFVHKYDIIFAWVCLGFLIIYLILIAYSYYKKSSSFNEVLNYTMIILLSV